MQGLKSEGMAVLISDSTESHIADLVDKRYHIERVTVT